MAKKIPLLEKMRANPRANWTIDDIAKLCAQNNIDLIAPTTGSHYKAASRHLAGHQTIPARRPIKPVYIELLVEMVDAHIYFEKQNES